MRREILKLEETIKDMRVAYARQYWSLINQDCDISSLITDSDWLGIYDVLLTKARLKEKNVDNK